MFATIAATRPASALPDDLCERPGVFVCDDFDDPSSVSGRIYAGDSTPQIEDGLLRFTIPSMSHANAGGDYRIENFELVGPGQALYIAYRIRADETAINLNAPGRKQFVLWGSGSSCGDPELAISHAGYGGRVVIPYSRCGAGLFDISLNQHDYQKQYPDYDCTYHGIRRGDTGNCVTSEPNVWDEYYLEITLGSFGQANSQVTLWHRKTGAWKRFIDRTDYTFHGSGGWSNFMLTVYMTGKKPAEHPTAHVDYDYLVMSTQPFREALESSIGPAAQAQAPTPAPRWLNTLKPGVWTPIALDTMADVDPEADPTLNPNHPRSAPWRAASGIMCVLACWNGGAFATRFGPSGALLVHGGGHQGYAGSEVYAFDLATRRWARVTDPWPDITQIDRDRGIYPDGSPLPAHTYDGVVYDEARNAFVVLRGLSDNFKGTDAANVKIVHALDLETKKWSSSPVHTGAMMHGGASAYDPKRKVLYMLPSYNTPPTIYDPATQQFEYKTGPGLPIDMAAAVDPVHDLLVYTKFRGPNKEISFRDLADWEQGEQQVIQNGEPPANRAGQHGWEWSDLHRGFVYYRGADGVWLLTKDSADRADRHWTWAPLSAVDSPAPEGASNQTGPYSRFQLAQYGSDELAMLVNRHDGPVWAMRLPSTPAEIARKRATLPITLDAARFPTRAGMNHKGSLEK